MFIAIQRKSIKLASLNSSFKNIQEHVPCSNVAFHVVKCFTRLKCFCFLSVRYCTIARAISIAEICYFFATSLIVLSSYKHSAKMVISVEGSLQP